MARPGGFTLIELLVVVAVVALLLGLLVPVLGAARRASYVAGCNSSLWQMSQAWQTLMIETDGVVPPQYNPGPGDLSAEQLLNHIMYPEDSRFFRSPNRGLKLTCPQLDRDYDDLTYGLYYFGYAMNPCWGASDPIGSSDYAKWDSLKSPSNYMLFADAEVWKHPTASPTATSYLGIGFDRPHWETSGFGFHHPGDRANVAFGDGHVGQVSQDVLSPKDAIGLPVALYDH